LHYYLQVTRQAPAALARAFHQTRPVHPHLWTFSDFLKKSPCHQKKVHWIDRWIVSSFFLSLFKIKY
jgi:hypothetical protein